MAHKRKFIHIQGQKQWCITTANRLIAKLPKNIRDLIYCSTSQYKFGDRTTKQIKNSNKRSEIENHLGSENSVLIFNSFDGFNPDLFCALVGLVKSPGLIILLSKEAYDWIRYSDPDYSRFCSYPYKPEDVKGRFINYFIQKLGQIDRADLITIKQSEYDRSAIIKLIKTINYNVFEEFTGSNNQLLKPPIESVQVIASIKTLALTNNNGTIVIYGNRGRGKSTAIGLAINQCLRENSNLNISIISQNSLNVRAIFAQIKNQIDPSDRNINFFPPHEYIRKNINCDLVIVDEAAAIPLNMLKKIVHSNSKSVFCTTTDGYEGSGMGFLLKFQDYLSKAKIPVSTVKLETPFRWPKNDPTERFIFSTFFPNKIKCKSIAVEKVQSEQLAIQKIDRDNLVTSPQKVQQLFSLLAQAHYRTTPDDLRYMLDSPDVEIWTAELENQPLAAMIVCNEGVIEDDFSDSIWLGQRRLSGHLIPQTLSSQSGLKQAIGFSYKRIVRIATLKQFRNQGIARQLVKSFELETKKLNPMLDFIGVSYGLESDLFKFWKKLEFGPVRLGHRENARSGLRSVLMLKPLSETAVNFYNELEQQFKWHMNSTTDSIAQKLILCLTESDSVQISTNWEQQRLDVYSFAFGHRQYLNCQRILKQLANYCLNQTKIRNQLNQQQLTVVTLKVLQDRNWNNVAKVTGFSGKSHLTHELRVIYAIFYNAVWGNKL